MKNLIYFFALLFCMASCKKIEDQKSVNFVKVKFARATDYPFFVTYDGKKNDFLLKDFIAVPPGQQRFGIYNLTTGGKVIDTTLNITKSINYYVFVPNGATLPVVDTALPPPPPPPPPPAGPFDGIDPSPAGFMQIKMFHNLAAIPGFDKIDIQILATINSADFEVFATVPGVSATPGKDFMMIQRPLRAGVVQQRFRFRFLKSDTKELITDVNGAPYSPNAFALSTSLPYQAFITAFEFLETEASNTTSFTSGGKYYVIKVRTDASK